MENLIVYDYSNRPFARGLVCWWASNTYLLSILTANLSAPADIPKHLPTFVFAGFLNNWGLAGAHIRRDICSLHLKSNRLTFPYYASFVPLFSRPACPASECRIACARRPRCISHTYDERVSYDDRMTGRERKGEKDREREGEYSRTRARGPHRLNSRTVRPPGAACQPTNERDERPRW